MAMGLTHREPFRGLRRRDESFEDFFRELFSRGDSDIMEPPAEIAESNGDVTVRMAVPGVDKDQIQISVTDNTLTVSGELRKEREERNANFYRQEIRYGGFRRTLVLPAEVDASKAKADLKNGMLKITLPKSQQPKAQQIKVMS